MSLVLPCVDVAWNQDKVMFVVHVSKQIIHPRCTLLDKMLTFFVQD